MLEQQKGASINEIENILKEKYKASLAEKIIKVITQISIIKYIENKPEYKNKLEETKNNLQKQLEIFNDKKQYIENITKEKKETLKEIEKIDKYINDDLKLKKEYIKQNEALPQEERVFSLSDFSEKIEIKRTNLQNKIEELAEKMKPKNYVKEKTKLEKEFEFINEIFLAKFELKSFIEEFIKLLIKTLSIQIEKVTTKKEIVEDIYKFRYLNLSVEEVYRKQLDKLQKKLITKGCNLKFLTIFSQDVTENYAIYKNIFKTKIIDLESTYIEISKDNVVKIYDENSLEKEENNNKFKDIIIKYNKRIKIFL